MGGSVKLSDDKRPRTKKTTRKKTYRGIYQEYLTGKIQLQRYQKVGILLFVAVLSGFIGWVWEFSLQEIDGGFRHLYIKGGNLLPWISLYAYGAILIILVSYRVRKHPWAVFVLSAIATGTLELMAGWLAYELNNGARYWNYAGRWWAFGNIDGFVCPVSAATFGLGALLLMYWLLPFCIYLSMRMSRKTFLTAAITLFTLVMVDEVTNLTLKSLGLPTAMNLYEAMGWKFKSK